jgi:hypothetical protein
MTDFSDPEQRLDYLLQHGIDAYNKAMEDPFAKTVVERPSTAIPSAWCTPCASARSTWSTASTAATRPWTAPARSREVKHDRALSRHRKHKRRLDWHYKTYHNGLPVIGA